MHCADCGRDFTVRGKVIKHGTPEGYQKHTRQRKGHWQWPACTPCQEANRVYHREYDSRPESVKMRHLRQAARMAALEDVRRQYPGVFSNAYRTQLQRRNLEEVRQHFAVPDWDDAVSRLVKAALGCDEASAWANLRMRTASQHEIEVLMQVRRLRSILADGTGD